ncbi:unnamed protein product [Miscanthus lutarioriparius]|uniref:Uncharacterized protein n=1 Tax=Miscanthus lutarioriparius TaxID=422564 RepID=A0A811PHG9_9POAL|nr:unnamed protein product [Miscanthus lutarioriparius]
MMRIMFDAISVTNETSYVPRSGPDDGEGEEHEAGHGDGDSERVEGRGSPHVTPNANKRPAQGSPFGKKKKTYRDQLMKRLVDTYEKKVQSSKNSATSHAVDHVRDEIGAMLEQVINDGAEEGSDEHYYATQLLKKKENRDVFVTLVLLCSSAEINMSISSDEDASQDESGTDEDFMVAYIAMELMGSTNSVAKNKEVVPDVLVMTGI